MASVSRAGMKCRRVRLGRGIRRVSEQAGRTCRTKLNNIEAKAEQCARGELVEESGKRAALHRHSCLFGAASPFDKPSSKTRNGGPPTLPHRKPTTIGASAASPLAGLPSVLPFPALPRRATFFGAGVGYPHPGQADENSRQDGRVTTGETLRMERG